VRILFTSDVHGRVGGTDPLTGDPFDGGLIRAAALLEGRRRADPHAIYLDLGDLVQGTPLSYRAIRERPEEPHPLVRILNRMGCAGMVVGNHEFNFGRPWLEAVRRHADFPLLAANVLEADGRPCFEPALRFERDGRTVAVLAVTTPQVPRWEEPWNIEGLRFRDAVETAREWVPRLRREADAVVVAAHMGWEGVTDGGTEIPAPPENDVARLVEEVDGIDAVIMAHTHRVDERPPESGRPHVVQAGWGGQALGELELTWSGEGPEPVPAGSPAEATLPVRPVTTFRVHRVLPATPEVPALRDEIRADEEDAAAHMAETLGEATADFPLENVRFADNAILTLLHRVHFDAVATDLSSAALFRARETLAAGPITRRDVFRIYPFENDLTILELTVDDVREYLEQIALAYLGPGGNGERPPLHPAISLYNHDALAGCEYTLDPGRPEGRRLERLTFGGEELPGDRRLTLSVTSYRAQGGGGYRALRRARIVERTGREIRRLIEDYVRARGRLEPEILGNWRVRGVE
jgi:2',3'-cyclic-nucleotide 2'-phosphodiesterase/3'-nucleotidase